ncbi:lysozyme inhibitor LprI family protein [Rubrivirga sp.]|uniref:lysozyme inhibitor LprI family protein n=1 Tax=Rubrivirga sp. TaxID=1885344 RepID=UPI003C71A029
MKHVLGVFVLMATASPILAQPNRFCQHETTQYALNDCARRAMEATDGELNRVYQDLTGITTGDREERIRTAQRAWVAFRDAHCDVASSDYEGGSMRPMVYGLCMAEVTVQRTIQLRSYYDELRER